MKNNKITLGFVMALLCLLLTLAGCNNGPNTNTSTNTNASIGHGWLYMVGYNYIHQGEADFLDITQNGNTLQATETSATYSLTYVNAYNVIEPECCGESSTTLKGTIESHNQVQLMYTGTSDYGQSVIGVFNPDANTLTLQGGHVYIPASRDDFRKAVVAVCLQGVQHGNTVEGGVCSTTSTDTPKPTTTPKPTPIATTPTPTIAPTAKLICNSTNPSCYYQGEATGGPCYDRNGNVLNGWVYSVGDGRCDFD